MAIELTQTSGKTYDEPPVAAGKDILFGKCCRVPSLYSRLEHSNKYGIQTPAPAVLGSCGVSFVVIPLVVP